jgi:hypothetical protein
MVTPASAPAPAPAAQNRSLYASPAFTHCYAKSKMQMNGDGGVDLYFAPKAPARKEANWIPTGEDFFIIFRLYGPEKAYFDRTWKLPDIENIAS